MRPSSLSPLFLSALLAACAGDRIPTASTLQEPIGGRPIAALHCTVSVTDEEMRCRDAAPSLAGSGIILGGQGVYVRLANTGTHYDRVTGIFGTDVTVQNLTAQPLGTPDGIGATGLRIFVSTAPFATAGTGSVEVANADGHGTFTEANQPFFLYPQIVPPQAVSATRRWEFRVDPGVEFFRFGVLLEGLIPGPRAVLRWVQRTPCSECRGGDVTSAGGVLFVAGNPSFYNDLTPPQVLRIWRSDDGGGTWIEAVIRSDTGYTGCSGTPYGATISIEQLWAYDASLLYASQKRDVVCTRYGDYKGIQDLIRSTNGGRTWSRVLSSSQVPRSPFTGIWGSGPDDVYVVKESDLLHSRDGFHTYTVQNFAGQLLRAVWGTDSDDVFVVGFVPWLDPIARQGSPSGLILHSVDRGQTWRETRFPMVGFMDVWGTADGHVWAVGWRYDSPGLDEQQVVAFYSPDRGESWTETLLPIKLPQSLAVWGTARDNVYVVGEGSILHYNGSNWWRIESGTSGRFIGISGTSPDHVIVSASVVLDPSRTSGSVVLQGMR